MLRNCKLFTIKRDGFDKKLTFSNLLRAYVGEGQVLPHSASLSLLSLRNAIYPSDISEITASVIMMKRNRKMYAEQRRSRQNEIRQLTLILEVALRRLKKTTPHN